MRRDKQPWIDSVDICNKSHYSQTIFMTRRSIYKIPTRHNVDLPWLWCAGCSFELIVWSLSYYHSPAFHTLPTSWINSENLLGQDLCHIFNRKFQRISQGFVAFTVSQKLYLVCLWRWQDIGHWTLKWPMSSFEYVTCVKQFLSISDKKCKCSKRTFHIAILGRMGSSGICGLSVVHCNNI